VAAFGADDELAQMICGETEKHFMREFLKRFRGRDPKPAIGKC
jgi:hypothetical protein